MQAQSQEYQVSVSSVRDCYFAIWLDSCHVTTDRNRCFWQSTFQ